MFVSVYNTPDSLAVHPVGVDGEACVLQGLQISTDGAGVAIFLLDQVGHGLAVLGGNKCPDDSPLTC